MSVVAPPVAMELDDIDFDFESGAGMSAGFPTVGGGHADSTYVPTVCKLASAATHSGHLHRLGHTHAHFL